MIKYKRAKSYVNVGELSKAMASIRSNGIAEVTNSVLDQLQAKHPTRPRAVKLQSQKQAQMDTDECMEDEGESKEGGHEFSRSVSDVINTILPSIIVGAEQILNTAKKARRLTSGGLQQITPWLLKRALLADTKQEGAIASGRLVTR